MSRRILSGRIPESILLRNTEFSCHVHVPNHSLNSRWQLPISHDYLQSHSQQNRLKNTALVVGQNNNLRGKLLAANETIHVHEMLMDVVSGSYWLKPPLVYLESITKLTLALLQHAFFNSSQLTSHDVQLSFYDSSYHMCYQLLMFVILVG